MEKEILLGKTPAEIQEVVDQLGLPKFTGKHNQLTSIINRLILVRWTQFIVNVPTME